MSYETELFEKIITIKDKVGWILKKFPHTRNSDQDLTKAYCKQFGGDPLEVFETIRRSRQQYNEKGEYLPTNLEVAKQRKINIEVWKTALGYQNQLF